MRLVILHSSNQASDYFFLAQLKSDLENLSAAETAVRGGDLLLSWSSRVQDFLRPAYGRHGDNPVPHHSQLVVPLPSPPRHPERRGPAFKEGRDRASFSTRLVGLENSSSTGSVSSRPYFGKGEVGRQKQGWCNAAVGLVLPLQWGTGNMSVPPFWYCLH